MPEYRLAYERTMEDAGIPWALEDESGERHYAREVRFEVPARTVLEPGSGRFHGYLVATGRLGWDGTTATIESED